MESNVFIPKMRPEKDDGLSRFFRAAAYIVLTLVLGLLPILFIPGALAAVSFSKVYLVALGCGVAIILLVLASLRSGVVTLVFPPALGLFWLFAFLAILGASLSGDRLDALVGNELEIHTAGFLVLLAVVMTVALFLGQAKASVSRLFVVLGVSAVLLQIFHLLRLIFGANTLSFSVFNAPTSSLVGSFNDLAIFSGLVILATIILLPKFGNFTLGKVLSAIVVINSLLLLAVVNFYLVWVVVGFISLVYALYFLVKDTWFNHSETERQTSSRFSLAIVGLVCVVSGAFVFSSDYLGGVINGYTDINYIEVRPSFSATTDIVRSVYAEDAFFGVGPNLFADAWREHKDSSINQTVFWNTNFNAGSGFVPTLFVTLGLVGGLAFLFFLGTFFYHSYRGIMLSNAKDNSWSLIGSTSFITAVYLWFMAIVYVPGTTIMLLTALATGLTLAATLKLKQQIGVRLDVADNRKYGGLFIAVALLLSGLVIYLLLGVSKQYSASNVYGETIRQFNAGSDFATTDAGLEKVLTLSTQDFYVAERAQLRLAEINRLSQTEVTEANQQYFNQLVSEGIALANAAINLDSTNPENHLLLTNFYSLLSPTDFPDVISVTDELFSTAKSLDPQNPLYLVLEAQQQIRNSDPEAARRSLTEAVRLKNNYTDALFLLSQLDIQAGNTESALALTRSMITIEPNNPTRYFQLGLLLAADQQLEPAAEAFESAVIIGGTYANARYFLALTYLDLGRNDDALNQLRLVLETNPGNEVVTNLISQVESGTYVRSDNTTLVPEATDTAVTPEGEVINTTELTETDIVTPLNRTGSTESVPEAEVSEETETVAEEVEDDPAE